MHKDLPSDTEEAGRDSHRQAWLPEASFLWNRGVALLTMGCTHREHPLPRITQRPTGVVMGELIPFLVLDVGQIKSLNVVSRRRTSHSSTSKRPTSPQQERQKGPHVSGRAETPSIKKSLQSALLKPTGRGQSGPQRGPVTLNAGY